ncbi:cadmium resistance transporter, partial [Staphylococcus haemolyticus]|uniref:cadmium resistance transporter n=1 Tax=Staphylococcus haemolyticus TaxID=1283 RepID=UPI00265C491A
DNILVKLFISEIVHTEDSFLLKLYYKFNFATEPFVPYFVTLSVTNLLITLFVFLILIFFLVFTAQKLANIPGVGEIVEKFGRWIMAVIYIALGLFIIIENDTIQTILGFIF